MGLLFSYAIIGAIVFIVYKVWESGQQARRDHHDVEEALRAEVREQTIKTEETAGKLAKLRRRHSPAEAWRWERTKAVDRVEEEVRRKRLVDALELERRDFESRSAALTESEREEEQIWREEKRTSLATIRDLRLRYRRERLTTDERMSLLRTMQHHEEGVVANIGGRVNEWSRNSTPGLMQGRAVGERKAWKCRRCSGVFHHASNNPYYKPRRSFSYCLACLEEALTREPLRQRRSPDQPKGAKRQS